MNKAFIAALMLLLIISCAPERTEPKGSAFDKVVNVMHVQASVNNPEIAGIPISFGSFGGGGSSADVYVGNFRLRLDAGGAMSYFTGTDESGNPKTVKVYHLKSLNVKIDPKVLIAVKVEHDNVVAAGTDTTLTRARLLEVSFVKYDIASKQAFMHSQTIDGIDTTTGEPKGTTLSFDQTYVPTNFAIILKFDVGSAGSQPDISRPSYLDMFVPAFVSWTPFPEEGGGVIELGTLEASIFGYVNDPVTGLPIINNQVVMGQGVESTTVLTRPDGYYELKVPIFTDLNDNPILTPFDLVFDGCRMQECQRSGVIDMKTMFAEQYKIYDFDPAFYPMQNDSGLVEADQGHIFLRKFIQSNIRNGEKHRQDLKPEPALPAAYLRLNTSQAQVNESVGFEGFSISTYDPVGGWVLVFGDGSDKTGTGSTMNSEHAYAKPGEYEAQLRFGTARADWSPMYKRKITVGITKPVATIDSLTPNPLILRFNVTDQGQALIPGEVTLTAHGSHPKGNEIVAWEVDPWGVNGTGKSLEAKKEYSALGNYPVRARFKDRLGVWSEYAVKTLVVKNASTASPLGKPKAHANIEPDPYIKLEDIIVKGTELTFNGWAEGGPIVKYKWDLNGDGQFESVSNTSGQVNHTFDVPGTYKVKFVVEDEAGNVDSVSIGIRVLDVYADSNMIPESHIVDKGQNMTMWYTLHNKDTEDVEVESSTMLWWLDSGSGFQQSEYEDTQAWTGVVKAGKSRKPWTVTETAAYPGKWRGDVQIVTQFGLVKTSLTKTITGASDHIDGSVSFSSDRQTYAIGDNMTLKVQSNMPASECDWNYRTGQNNDWTLSLERTTADRNGNGAFVKTADAAGTFKAFAECFGAGNSHGRSNEIQFTVVPATLTLSADRDHYHKNSGDKIKLTSKANFLNPRCYVFYRDVVNMPEYYMYDQMPFDASGNGAYSMSIFMEVGSYKAQLWCDNGPKSNEVAFAVNPAGANETVNIRTGQSLYYQAELELSNSKINFFISSTMAGASCLISTKKGNEAGWFGLATVTTDNAGKASHTYRGRQADYWSQSGSWSTKATCDGVDSNTASYTITSAQAVHPSVKLQMGQSVYSHEKLESESEKLTFLIDSTTLNAACLISTKMNNGGWVGLATIITDSAGKGSFTYSGGDVADYWSQEGAWKAKASCDGVESNIAQYNVVGQNAAPPAPAVQQEVKLRVGRDIYSQEGLADGTERLAYLIKSNMPNTECTVALNSEFATEGRWKAHARLVTDQSGAGSFVSRRANLAQGRYAAMATCADVRSNQVQFAVMAQSAVDSLGKDGDLDGLRPGRFKPSKQEPRLPQEPSKSPAAPAEQPAQDSVQKEVVQKLTLALLRSKLKIK